MADRVKPVRLEYRAPTLRVYGDAKTLTETKTARGLINDGKKNKTH